MNNEFRSKNINFTSIFTVINASDKRKLLFYSAVQMFLTILDLLAIILIAYLSVLLSGSKNQFAIIQRFALTINPGEYTQKNLLITISLTVLILFTVKSLVHAIVTKRTYYYLARKSANLTQEIIGRLFSRNLDFLKTLNYQEFIYNSSRGVDILCLQVLAPTTLLVADIASVLILVLLLTFVSPSITFVIVLLFGTSVYILSKIQNSRSQLAGKKTMELEVQANNKINEVLSTFRESFVKRSGSYYSTSILTMREKAAKPLTSLYFYPSLAKITFEGLIIVSAFIIAVSQVIRPNLVSSVPLISIFLASGFRIAPIALRIQQNSLQIKSSMGSSGSALKLIHRLRDENRVEKLVGDVEITELRFAPEVDVNSLSLEKSQGVTILRDITLQIHEGEKIIIAGASGSGKTSLIEVILGLTPFSSGNVTISGLSPEKCIDQFAGLVAYVPQNFYVSSGTIRENLSLGFSHDTFSEADYWNCLKLAKLDTFVDSLPKKLDTLVGEIGSKLSGGEKQRLAIARSLITKPKLLIIDEGTSALDLATESQIAREILSLGDDVTVIMIAHRVGAMEAFDNIIYLSGGKIVGRGNFSKMSQHVSDFNALIQRLD